MDTEEGFGIERIMILSVDQVGSLFSTNEALMKSGAIDQAAMRDMHVILPVKCKLIAPSKSLCMRKTSTLIFHVPD